MSLTNQEKVLAVRIGFDEKVLLQIKQTTGGSLHQLSGFFDVQTGKTGEYAPISGLLVTVPGEAETCVRSLQPILYPQGYLPFVVEEPPFKNGHQTAVLKTTDPFDILKVVHTIGNEVELSNADIIFKLQEWNRRFSIQIIGASGDWVDFELGTLPVAADTQPRLPLAEEAIAPEIDAEAVFAFAEEVYTFCPDIIEQGYYIPAEEQAEADPAFEDDEDTIFRIALQMLASDIQKTRRLFLWWD